MNSITPCDACGHELRIQTDSSGRALVCPACGVGLRVARPPLRFPLRGRRLGLALLLVIAVSLPAAFGAATMRWSPAPPVVKEAPSQNPMGPLIPMPLSPIPLGRGGRDSSAPSVPPRPALAEPHLAIPSGVDSRLGIPAGVTSDEGLRLVGRLPAGLAFASDPSRGLLLSSGADGSLYWHDAETLRPVGRCLLPGAAYQMACDGGRGLLYAALSPPDKLQLGPLGDRFTAVGDIHVFDLGRLLALPASATARASKVIPCAAHVWSMHLARDRESLFYMAENQNDVRVVRVDARGRDEPKVLEIRSGGTQALVPTPDGKTLFGLAGGRVFAVDVADWSIRWTVLVGGSVLSLAVGPGDQLYLVERRLTHHLLVVDPATRRVVSRRALGLEGRPYLCGSADGRRVFFSNSAVTSGEIISIEGGGDAHRPRLAGWARGDRSHLIWGGVRLSDDGRFLLTGVGQLFRVGS